MVRNGWIWVIFKISSPKAVVWLHKNCNTVHKYYELIHIHCTRAAWTHKLSLLCSLRVSKWLSAELFLLCLTFKCLNANSNVKTAVVFVHRNSRRSIMRTSCTLWDLSLSISQWDTTVRVSPPSSGWVNFCCRRRPICSCFNGFNRGFDFEWQLGELFPHLVLKCLIFCCLCGAKSVKYGLNGDTNMLAGSVHCLAFQHQALPKENRYFDCGSPQRALGVIGF